MKLLKYHISDTEEFLLKLHELVDINVDIDEFKKNPFLKSNYFGKIQFGNFTIYSTRKSIIGKKIILKIEGGLDSKNYVEFKAKMYHFWTLLINNLILVLLGLVLVSQNYFGIVFIVIALIQTSWGVYIVQMEQLKFKTRIENIID